MSLWTDEFLADQVEDKADAKSSFITRLIPTVLQPLFAQAEDTAGRSWELRAWHCRMAWQVWDYWNCTKIQLPKGRSFVPLADAQRAVRLAREAKEWKLVPRNSESSVFLQAGMASTAATHFRNLVNHPPKTLSTGFPAGQFAILVYPVVTMGEFTHNGSKKPARAKRIKNGLITFQRKKSHQRTPPIFMARGG